MQDFRSNKTRILASMNYMKTLLSTYFFPFQDCIFEVEILESREPVFIMKDDLLQDNGS